MSDFDKYYEEQAGSGISFYPGIRYQKGHGALGRLFGRVLPAVLPILKSIGRTVLGTGLDVADDVVSGKSDLQTSIKTRGAAAAKSTAKNLITKGREKLAQSGSGVSRPRRSTANRKMALFTIKAGGALATRKRRSRKRSKTSTTKASKRTVRPKKRKSKARKSKRSTKKKGSRKRSTGKRSKKTTNNNNKASNLPPYLSY